MPPALELLEREGEIDALRSALRASAAGAGSVVLLQASAGLGKSRLLTVAADLAADLGVTVLAARATPLDRGIPFGLVRTLLSPLMQRPSDCHRMLTGEGAMAASLFDLNWPASATADVTLGVLDGLCAMLASAADGGPLALTLDDLQWADRQSLRFLLALAGRVEQLPIAVLAAYRPEPASRPSTLAMLEADRSVTVLPLSPLSEQACGVLVRGAVGGDEALVHACLAATGGNPFYLGALLRDLAASSSSLSAEVVAQTVPATVIRSVAARLTDLPRSAADLARALSVLGGEAPVALAAQLADLSVLDAEDAADALIGADLLGRDDPLAFTHPLITSAVYEDQGPFARARAHRSAAELLMADGAGCDHERVSAHLQLCRPQHDPVAAEVLLRAATLARARGETSIAVSHLERALGEDPPAELRAGLLVELAGSDLASGSALAEQRLGEALSLLDDPVRQAITLRTHSAVLQHSGDLIGAAQSCRRALDLVPDDHPLVDVLRAGFVGAALLHPSLRAEGEATLRRALAESLGGRPPRAPALAAQLAIHTALNAYDDEVVREFATRAFDHDPLVDDDSLGVSLGYAAQALIWVDALEPARRLLDEAADAARSRGQSMPLAVARVNQATIALHQGRLADAVTAAERALDVYRYGWTTSTWSTPVLAMAQLERGDLTAAHHALEMGSSADPTRADFLLLREARARIALADHDPSTALTEARTVGESLDTDPQGDTPRLFRWRTIAAEAALQLGERERAAELVGVAVDQLRRIGTPRQLGETLSVAALVAGDQDGLALHEQAVAVLRTSPSRLQYTQSLLHLGAAQRRTGNRIQARATLTRALDLADGCGALRLARRATDELRLLGARPRRNASTGPDSLTPAERAVAALAAAGHSNPEIAQRLYIARKTVESHLASTYRKLGVRSRHDLAAALGAPRQ